MWVPIGGIDPRYISRRRRNRRNIDANDSAPATCRMRNLLLAIRTLEIVFADQRNEVLRFAGGSQVNLLRIGSNGNFAIIEEHRYALCFNEIVDVSGKFLRITTPVTDKDSRMSRL